MPSISIIPYFPFCRVNIINQTATKDESIIHAGPDKRYKPICDEISIRRGHSYMTVVLDYLTGRVVWMGIARRADTLMKFFDGMTKEQKEHLDRLLELNETISKAMILKDKLNRLQLFWRRTRILNFELY